MVWRVREQKLKDINRLMSGRVLAPVIEAGDCKLTAEQISPEAFIFLGYVYTKYYYK